MTKHHYHAVIWIDHREARVFHFNPTDVDKLILHPDNPTRHIHHKANSIGSGHASADATIFTRSPNRSQTPAQFSSPDQRMQRLNWSSTFTFKTPS
jgi:hypothetical protein